MKIAILGAAGRMGQKLIELARGTELEVVAKVKEVLARQE